MNNPFFYYASIYSTVFDYRVLALADMSEIIDSHMFAFKVYTVPQTDLQIPAFDSYVAEIKCRENTWLYGVRAVNANPESTLNNWSFRLYAELGRDIDGGVFRSPVSAQDQQPRPNSSLPYQLLESPVLLPEGRVICEVSNKESSSINIQVLLIVAEPVPALGDFAGRFC